MPSESTLLTGSRKDSLISSKEDEAERSWDAVSPVSSRTTILASHFESQPSVYCRRLGVTLSSVDGDAKGLQPV